MPGQGSLLIALSLRQWFSLSTISENAIAALAHRRLAHEPAARIIGTKEFWSLTLRLDAATLVPRPETETVVAAALAAVDVRGARTRALRIATRLADHLVTEFAGQKKGLDGHPVIETALAELYRETGQVAYLELARQFVDQRGHGLAGDSGLGHRYLQDATGVRESVTEVGHAVRALYLEAGVTDVAVETGDTGLLASSARRWAAASRAPG